MFQVIEGEEEGEDTLLKRIKKEPDEAEEECDDPSAIQIRVNASVPRQGDDDQSSDRVSGWLSLYPE